MVQLDNWRGRIRVDPAVHHGDPCVAGTRVPINSLSAAWLKATVGSKSSRVYPQLKRDDIQTALLDAAEAVNRFEITKL